ncbi:exonuclease domain-containing protein [Spiroplasma tabanidicola]|uniref:DNA polymerase III subunit epsilon n=1 Tax=Spiroplasma tabanidicola TaxID=324079 RepID=A0A6I6C3V2_9MOLU|nr:exonuclease domain-containing protein [Spiroplasma tabanidicola]QGS51487.1 DNA polymerase III subunit epsilon [Spiroplasma tabanidicola]
MNKPSFIVIDFETANYKNEPCQVGIVICENGVITDRYETLISLPKYSYIDFKYTMIHNIYDEQLVGQPGFVEVCKKIKEKLQKGYVVIAHNAKFDMMVLKRAMQNNNIEMFDFDYACSVEIIRNSFPKRFLNHKLSTLANALNIKFNHHNALADSEATCEVLLKCFNDHESFLNALKHPKYILKKFTTYFNKKCHFHN